MILSSIQEAIKSFVLSVEPSSIISQIKLLLFCLHRDLYNKGKRCALLYVGVNIVNSLMKITFNLNYLNDIQIIIIHKL